MTPSALRRGRLVFDLVALAIGAAAIISGFGYRVVLDNGQIGPGFMPLLAGVLIVVFALIDGVREYTGNPLDSPIDNQIDAELEQVAAERAEAMDASGNADDGSSSDERDTSAGATGAARKFVLVVAVMFVALLLTPVLGMIPAFFLMLLAITLGVERLKILTAALVSILATAAIYGIFVMLLGIRLPIGIFGI